MLAVVFATVATLVFYKGYGRADQIEQLPIILRALDSGFLTQDFFTNVTEGAIARLHYSKLLAALIQLTGSIPLLFLLITWISNIAIAQISFGITRDLFEGSARAGLFAVALVMAAYTFSLGWISVGSMWMLTPTTLVLPFVLAAVWALIKSKVVLAVSLCVVASAIHPLLGLEVGGILLFADVLRRVLLARSINGRQLTIWSACALLLGAAAYVLVYPQLTQEKIASPDFIYILATFRHPHHYVPSTFGWVEYVAAAVFLIVSAQAFLQWEAKHQNPEASIAVKVLATILLGLCLPGYLLVEVWPVRLVTTAQLFRMLYIVKWLGLIFLAGKMANARNWNGIVQYAGAMHPFALGKGKCFEVDNDGAVRQQPKLPPGWRGKKNGIFRTVRFGKSRYFQRSGRKLGGYFRTDLGMYKVFPRERDSSFAGYKQCGQQERAEAEYPQKPFRKKLIQKEYCSKRSQHEDVEQKGLHIQSHCDHKGYNE